MALADKFDKIETMFDECRYPERLVSPQIVQDQLSVACNTSRPASHKSSAFVHVPRRHSSSSLSSTIRILEF